MTTPIFIKTSVTRLRIYCGGTHKDTPGLSFLTTVTLLTELSWLLILLQTEVLPRYISVGQKRRETVVPEKQQPQRNVIVFISQEKWLHMFGCSFEKRYRHFSGL
jgi:hypothetical protein